MALRLATRGSALALAQARAVAEMLSAAELVEAASDGEPGDKSRFVRAVERELLGERADVGVHSAKDLPAGLPDGLLIAGAPAREAPSDAWVGEAESLEDVPEGCRVGTSSLRRRSQLLALRPDLRVLELHGNVDTRLRRLDEGELDAIVIASAGLRRLRRADEIAFEFEPRQMTPAAGQGALALQIREDDTGAREAVAAVSDRKTMVELTAERAAVAAMNATCNTPVGIHARLDEGRIAIEGYAGLSDGSDWVRERLEGDASDPAAVGETLANTMLEAGAREILDRAEASEDRRSTNEEGA